MEFAEESTMDAAQEARCKEMLAEILARLEEMNAQLFSMAEPWTPSSPSSTSILTTDTEAEPAVISPIPSPTSVPPRDADPGSPAAITKLPNPPVSIDDHLDILFDADSVGIDHLSRLPDSLLLNIVSRLPIKDAARTAVLSRRWTLIRHAAQLLVDPSVLSRPHVLHELDLGKAATTFPASPTPSCAEGEVFLAFPGNGVATHVRCSTLGLYQNVALDFQFDATKLFIASPTNIEHRQGNKVPKPPWLLGTEVLSSWFGKKLLVSGFLLEASPWYRYYTAWTQWQPSMLPRPHVLLKMASSVICSQKEEKWKMSLLAENLKCAQIMSPMQNSSAPVMCFLWDCMVREIVTC